MLDARHSYEAKIKTTINGLNFIQLNIKNQGNDLIRYEIINKEKNCYKKKEKLIEIFNESIVHEMHNNKYIVL